MNGTTRHGLQIIAVAFAACLLLNLLVERAGLKYVQGVIWPTDLPAFAQLPSEPIDVAVFGSSRASFALPPDGLDFCLSETLGRPTNTVNLARTFATAYDAEVVVRDLLDDNPPEVLVLAVGAEFVDEYNHQFSAGLAAHAGVADIPTNLAHARGLSDVFAAIFPIGRGAESAALYLSGRYDNEARLTWMMIHHGGGQFCYGNTPCERQNKAYEKLLSDRWDAVSANVLPTLREDRYEPYLVGDGQVHDGLLALLDWARARDVQVAFVKLPMHGDFQEGIPRSVRQSFTAYIDAIAEEHGAIVYDGHNRDYRTNRRWYLDPDHLNADGAKRFTKTVCRKVLAPMLGGGE